MMNAALICEETSFHVWNRTANTFDVCFLDFAVQTPIHVLFTALSFYFIGLNRLRNDSLRFSTTKWIVSLCSLLLSISILGLTVSQFFTTTRSTHSIVSITMEGVAWTVHIVYVLHHIIRKIRLPLRSSSYFVAILLVFVGNGLSFQNVISAKNPVNWFETNVLLSLIRVCLTFGLILVLLVNMCYDSTNYTAFVETNVNSLSEEELLQMSSSYHEEMREENANIISRITFCWVNELMKRGVKSMLKSPSDLFTLPTKLSSSVVHKSVDEIRTKLRAQTPIKLWKLLMISFGTNFALIGVLKFIADILGFAGPLLLNYIVLYLEDTRKLNVNGFYYATGLMLSTLVSSLCITLFNYHITNATLKIKSTLVCLIYQKMFKVRSHTLLNAFSIGEVLNFSSTDTERISSFCPNLLQLFSLPVQLTVSLFLLYSQLGLSFVSGLTFAIIVLPINKFICDKIGDLSTKMMTFKDKRIKLMTEILTGIRIVKMHAWEQLFAKRIEAIRSKEMKYMKGRKYLDALCVYLWATTPVLISWLSFTTFVLLDNKLTSAKVFTSLALFNMLIMPLNALPWVLNGVVEAWVSMKRIQKFLSMSEIAVDDHYNIEPPDDADIVAQRVTFQRVLPDVPDHNNFRLGPLDLFVKQGAFIGVIGAVGAGKSSLLSAFIGEMLRSDGHFGIRRSEIKRGIGYVSQEPFIQNTSIRDNIIFGKIYDFNLYTIVLNACALAPDLQVLKNGDNTLAGDRGTSLSGGQKARVALARALYQDFNVYLLDDPFSSVDIHVAKHIYTKCVTEFLATKTKIISTHHIEFLSAADLIFVMKDGKIIDSGPPDRVLHSDDYRKLRTSTSETETVSYANDRIQEVEEEGKEDGVVKWSVYKQYLRSVGFVLCFTIFLSFVSMQGSRTFSDWWLAHWTSQMKHNSTSSENIRYLEYFALISALNSILTLVRAFLYAFGGIVAAITIHRLMLKSIFLCSTQFFDSKPFGRTMTRFSSDLFNIDDALPFTLNIFLAQVFSLFASIVITVYGIPYIAILLVLLMIPYFYIQWYYRWTSRDLKRLCSITLAPIYSHFAETFYGLSTIRAFHCISRFANELYSKLDDCNTTQYAANAASQWLNLRLQVLGVIVTSTVAFLAVSLHYFSVQKVEAGFIGLALAYSLSITSLLNGVIQTFTQVETDMVSVERVQQYIESSKKEPQDGENPDHWPESGKIYFNNVSMRYNVNSPLVLSNVSFELESKQFVGIVGRTGSGKSSLFQCLFRLVNPETGTITIDGMDIRTVNLKTLRSNLFIIPQESFLFSGTLRENIDPLLSHSDSAIWKALRDCQLEAFVLSLGGLGVDLSECGRDFSVGQKQLLCLARALLNRKKIICLDEATAAIDYKTEVIIHQTIRRSFQHSTVLMIAHKIESVLKCDKVIVMDNGKVAEMGSPNDLIENRQSLLYTMFSSFEL